jgi:hypothetical protein
MAFNLQLDGDFTGEGEGLPGRFGSRGEKEIKEELIDQKDSVNTKRMTKSALKLFTDFLVQYKDTASGQEQFSYREVGKKLVSGEAVEWEDCSQLNKMLKYFYANARKNNGDLYKKKSFQSHKHGLARYFKQEYNLNIVDDSRFSDANQTYASAMVELKRKGKGCVDHTKAISDKDLKKLYTSWDLSNPQELQDKVMFDILFFLCRRGQENLPAITKSTFKL